MDARRSIIESCDEFKPFFSELKKLTRKRDQLHAEMQSNDKESKDEAAEKKRGLTERKYKAIREFISDIEYAINETDVDDANQIDKKIALADRLLMYVNTNTQIYQDTLSVPRDEYRTLIKDDLAWTGGFIGAAASLAAVPATLFAIPVAVGGAYLGSYVVPSVAGLNDTRPESIRLVERLKQQLEVIGTQLRAQKEAAQPAIEENSTASYRP